MKRLLTFVLMFMMASALLDGISYGAGEERFVFSDLTAQDKKTGLVWTRNANTAGKKMTWYDALKFIEKLNKQNYGGYSDWRLPATDELLALADYAKGEGYVIGELFNKIGFRNVELSCYWSFNICHENNTSSVCMFTNMEGKEKCKLRSGRLNVWPVRSGQISSADYEKSKRKAIEAEKIKADKVRKEEEKRKKQEKERRAFNNKKFGLTGEVEKDLPHVAYLWRQRYNEAILWKQRIEYNTLSDKVVEETKKYEKWTNEEFLPVANLFRESVNEYLRKYGPVKLRDFAITNKFLDLLN